MNGKQAKRARAVARKACDPNIRQMAAKKWRVLERAVTHPKTGEAMKRPDGTPFVIPEHFRVTAFWPQHSFRMCLKLAKKAFHNNPAQRADLIALGRNLLNDVRRASDLKILGA